MLSFLKPKEIIKPYYVPDFITCKVENFNTWFNAKNNNAVYAHSGIFLRLDKLSESHIQDYFLKCYGIDYKQYEPFKNDFGLIQMFLENIREDWRRKINSK